MKNTFKVLCLVLGVLIGFSSQAQESFSSYENSYIGNSYPIQIASKDKEKFTLYIDAMSLDATHKKGGIMINEKKYQEFLDAINDENMFDGLNEVKAKELYTEYKNWCNDNGERHILTSTKFGLIITTKIEKKRKSSGCVYIIRK